MKTKLAVFAFLLAMGMSLSAQAPLTLETTANGLTQHWSAGGNVTRGQIVKLNSSGQVVPVATTDTSGALGVAVTSATLNGDMLVSVGGTPLVQVDGACTAGNVVIISTTNTGLGHCVASGSGQTIGTAVNAGSSFVNVQLSPLSSANGGGGITSVSSLPALPCTEGLTVYLNITPKGNYTCTGGIWTPVAPGVGTIYPATYGVKMNGGQCMGAGVTMTNGVATVSCTSANFCNAGSVPCAAGRTTNIGMGIYGTNGAGGVLSPVGSAVVLPRTTIATVISATSITVTAAPTSTCSASVNCWLTWAPVEDTAWTAVDTAVTNNPQCSQIIFPPGVTMIVEPHWNTTSTQCVTNGTSINVRNGYACAVPGSCIIALAPDFDFAACTFGNGGTGCLFGQTYPSLEGFVVTGGGASLNGQTHANIMVNPYVPYTRRIFLQSFGASATSLIGYACSVCVNDQIVIDGFGKTAMTVSNGPYNWSFTSFYGDTSGAAIDLQTAGHTLYSFGDQLGSTSGTVLVGLNAANTSFITHNLNVIGDTAAGGQSIFLNAPTTNFTADGSHLTNGLAGSFVIGCSSATSNAHVRNMESFTGAAAGFYTQSTCKVFDDGGNQGVSLNPSNATYVVGSFVPYKTVAGQCTGVGTAASTLALRVSGTSVTGAGIPTTCTSTTIDAGQVMDHASSMYSLNVTATAAGTNASSGVVTVLKNGAGTTLTCTIGTGTSCFDNNAAHNVAFVNGDLISFQFTTQAADTLAGLKAYVSAH